MRNRVEATEPEAGSEIRRRLPGAYFHDCYRIALPSPDASAFELYLQVVAHTPSWVNALMGLRNWMAGLAGLKNLGRLAAFDATRQPGAYKVGDRVGIFTLLYLTPEEVILGDSDKHLDVALSVRRVDGKWLHTCTVVHVHNALGRLYMLPVTPLHKLIVQRMLANATHAHPQSPAN